MPGQPAGPHIVNVKHLAGMFIAEQERRHGRHLRLDPGRSDEARKIWSFIARSPHGETVMSVEAMSNDLIAWLDTQDLSLTAKQALAVLDAVVLQVRDAAGL